jgi:hypothetical protein
MPKYLSMNPDVIKENYVDLPNNISDDCWNRLAKWVWQKIYTMTSQERGIFFRVL